MKIFNDLKNKYENIIKKNKEFQIQFNYYLHKIKDLENEKEKYIKKNKKLKEEIHKIPSLIEQEMNKFREETQKNISKKIFELEQENKILKNERHLLNSRDEVNIIGSYEFKLDSNGENPNIRKQ
jgi:DNA repair ATPase RecN